MKLCDTCIYRNEDEYHKPCIVYRDDCEFYEKERGDMTREELIRNLKYTMKKHEHDRVDTFGTNISLMCKDMLDYLEQEPCGDAISRENTLKAMIEQLGIRNEDYLLPAEKTLYEVVKNMPPVTAEPKTGRWIGHREHCENLGVISSGLGAYEWCSNCDCGIDVRERHRNHYNYCPNCGCRMFEP